MKKDPRIFIHHILESISLIEGYSKGKPWRTLLHQYMTRSFIEPSILSISEVFSGCAAPTHAMVFES
jgi:uncharacterized protein with HEPN domain